MRSLENIYLEIGKRIRQQRKAHGLTREEFAENLSTTMQYISRLERAKNKVSIEYLYRIADALDCSIYTLLPATQLPQRKFFSEELMYQLDHCSLKQKQFIANATIQVTDPDVTNQQSSSSYSSGKYYINSSVVYSTCDYFAA